MKFRVHHILCTIQFAELSGQVGFNEPIMRIFEELRANPDRKIILINGADGICANCSRMNKDNHCINAEHNACLVKKEKELLKQLGLKAGKFYTFKELADITGACLTKETFDYVCDGCENFQMGYCKHGRIIDNLEHLNI